MLFRSVGPAPLLARLGVPVVLDSPGVGENLHDHLQVRIQYKVRNTRTLNEMTQSLWRKAVRDLTGQTAFQRRREQFRQGIAVRGALVANLVLWALLAAAGYWWLYPVLWVLPLATWYQLVTRIRNIAEHAVVPDNDDPLRNTRTTLASVVERLFIAPYWVNQIGRAHV